MAASPQIYPGHRRHSSTGAGRWWKDLLAGGSERRSPPPLDFPDDGSVADPDAYFENPSPLITRSPATAPATPGRSTPAHHLPVILRPQPGRPLHAVASAALSAVLHSFLPTCRGPSFPTPGIFLSSSRRKRLRFIGTLFGPRRGRVSFAVQDHPGLEPAFMVELAFPTSALIEEMSTGAVRVLLECEKTAPLSDGNRKPIALWQEPVWTVFCNGRRGGVAVSRPFGEQDRRVFHSICAISAGAGVLPAPENCPLPRKQVAPAPPMASPTAAAAVNSDRKKGKEKGAAAGDVSASEDVMFMRAKFERVVGSKDSEAFYMMNPDGGRAGGGPELSVFLLRL